MTCSASKNHRHHRGFTLIEILVVIGIIVLLLTLAMPAFNFMTGARSEESALNLIGSTLTHARAEAIGVQRARGIVIYRESESQQFAVGYVEVPDYAADYDSSKAYPMKTDGNGLPIDTVVRYRDGYWLLKSAANIGVAPDSAPGSPWEACITPLRHVPDLERTLLPKGVAPAVLLSTIVGSTLPGYPHVFLFGPDGSLQQMPYFIPRDGEFNYTISSFPSYIGNGANSHTKRTDADVARSLMVVGVFDEEAAKESGDSNWLQKNVEVRMISRYNGTLLRAP